MEKETTSSAKIAKKARQIYRKDFRKEVEENAKHFSRMLKPKPRWIPKRVYLLLLSQFFNIKG